MDLSNFDLKNSSAKTLHLLHPGNGTELYVDDDNERPMTITLKSADSDDFRKIMRMYGNKKLAKGNKQKQTVEEFEETSVKILARVTESWQNITENGELVQFNIETAERIYTDYAWIREQVDEFIHDRTNFLN